MRKTIVLCSASLFAAWAGTAFAGWDPILINTSTVDTFTAETAGKSGNVKACFSVTRTTQTFQWTQSQTGKTRGTFDVVTDSNAVQVADSECEPQ
jgi:hypothetical protein